MPLCSSVAGAVLLAHTDTPPPPRLFGCNCCSETYQYYTLPFCQHKSGKKYVTEDLGEVLEGDRLVNTPYEIKFREDVETQTLCTKKLTGNDLENIRMAIAEDYYFQVIGFCLEQHQQGQASQAGRQVMQLSKCSAEVLYALCGWRTLHFFVGGAV